MRPALFLGVLLVSLTAQATHIIGGEIFYMHLSGTSYEVHVRIYRDCGPANTNNQGFDDPIEIGIFNASGVYESSVSAFSPAINGVPVQLNNPCLTPPSSICVEQAEYVTTVQLSSGTGGHTLAYQRCCRSPAVINLNDPNTQGLTATVHVPDPAQVGDNSSPHFTEYPPIALCVQQGMAFSHAAEDPDGDDLVYDLCAPFIGGDQFNAIPSPPSAPPYTTVLWGSGYGVANMINASPALSIDPSTGWITLTPTLIGSFTVGVRVKEFRSGVQLSEVIRDFRFDVVNCQVTVISSIQDQDVFCDGLTVQMENGSTNSDGYHWDFGVPGVDTDTSSEVEPSFIYPSQGVYTVTLIANPGWPCADTSANTFNVFNPVTVHFDRPPVRCADEQPFELTALGDHTSAANATWTFDGGTANDPSALITHPSFTDPGTHAVHVHLEENGCEADYTDSVSINPRPVPLFDSDTVGCAPLSVQFSNSSSAWTPMTYAWDLGDGTTSEDFAPGHEYVDPGLFTVKLTVRTDSGCIAEETLTKPGLIRVWPQPTAHFVTDVRVASLLDPDVTVTDASSNAMSWDFEVEGIHYDTTVFTHIFNDAGWFNITLVATSGLGCSDTTVTPFFVGDHLLYAPTAFTPDGDGLNEVWLPQVKGARLYQLEIFDRWGEVMFSTTDPHAGWDGHNAVQGTYAYKIWLSEWGPLEKEYNGSFTLLR